MSAPLDGVRVLDLTRVLAGPTAGRMLADLGADVVKVEPPEGDVTRTFRENDRESAYFRQQNAGKRAICVDLTTDEGRDLVRRLAARADIVLENFRPGILARFGLAWPDLSAINPRLVMLSISGFGQDGPERDRAAYAGVIHAETGVTARQPRHEGLPLDFSVSMADTVSGLHGVIGVLAALRHRDNTGVGQHVDIAMLDAMLISDDFAAAAIDEARYGTASGERREPDAVVLARGRAQMIAAPGGPMIVMGEFKWIWKSIHERLGIADPSPPDADLTTKVTLRRRAWTDLVASFDDRDSLTAALDKANLAWGVVKSTAEAVLSPTFAHRGSIVEIDDPVEPYAVIRAPYRFSSATSGVRRGAPRQDEHRAEVIADWLG